MNLRGLWSKGRSRLSREIRGGAAWFTLSNFLSPAVSVLCGPLILKKIGLEEYAQLSLAIYFFTVAAIYTDFGSYAHLLAVFLKKSPGRFSDFGNTLMLRAGLLILFFAALGFFAWRHPRQDDAYWLIALYMAILTLPIAIGELYFISRRFYARLFQVRAMLNGSIALCLIAWYFSPWKSALFVPAIYLFSTMLVALYLLWHLGWGAIVGVLFRAVHFSLRDFRGYVKRILPLAATQLVTPYFLAYALPWFTLVASDQMLLGAFSVSYRIVLGFSALLAPLVFFMMARAGNSRQIPSYRRMLGFALLVGALCWVLGMGLLWFYFRFSNVEPALFSHAAKYLSILMLGVVFACYRTPIVSYCTIHERYKPYFLIHVAACAPTLLISWLARSALPREAVPWLVCLPDLLATLGLIWYYYSESRRSEPRAEAGLVRTIR